MTKPSTPIRIPAPADDLCLTFANTRYWRGKSAPTETLADRDDLLRWVGQEIGLDETVSRGLMPEAPSAFQEAIGLREMIHGLFVQAAGQGAIQPAALAALNAALGRAPRRAVLSVIGRDRGWAIVPDGAAVTTLLAPILWSAGDLLLGPRFERVRQCDNPVCGWLFLDDSKSGNRRWCAMSACGNRAKAHRHYEKRKARAAEAP
jgi:predicted RNA-binding Zn ribbon-like protein